MISVPTYILGLFALRLAGFFDHWYRNGTRFFWKRFVDITVSLEGTFAVILTVRHLFEPLYQDKTIIGYILGFIFRTLRAAIGAITYVFVTAIIFAIYLLWLAMPAYAIYKVLSGII